MASLADRLARLAASQAAREEHVARHLAGGEVAPAVSPEAPPLPPALPPPPDGAALARRDALIRASGGLLRPASELLAPPPGAGGATAGETEAPGADEGSALDRWWAASRQRAGSAAPAPGAHPAGDPAAAARPCDLLEAIPDAVRRLPGGLVVARRLDPLPPGAPRRTVDPVAARAAADAEDFPLRDLDADDLAWMDEGPPAPTLHLAEPDARDLADAPDAAVDPLRLADPPLAPPPWPAAAAELLAGADWARDIDWPGLLFLDTETTGLGRDQNTFAFLVGLGWWDAATAAFHLELHLAEGFADEGPMLEAVLARIERCGALCTYNGRAFDLPLLAQRAAMVLGRALPDAAARHLDLLPGARRLWRETAGGASLRRLERVLLARQRARDVSGRLIPRLYHDYLHGRHRRRMIPVLRHNAQDVASLSDLLGDALTFLADPTPAADGARSAAATFRGLGRLYAARGGDDARVVGALENALALARGRDEDRRCRRELAAACKRAGRWDDALPLWRSLAAEASHDGIAAAIELAIHAERRERDLRAARDWAERASILLERIDTLRAMDAAPADPPPDARLDRWRADLDRRLARLARRLARPAPRTRPCQRPEGDS